MYIYIYIYSPIRACLCRGPSGYCKRVRSGVSPKPVAGPYSYGLLLWPVSSSSATIPMDFLFLGHYSYGPMGSPPKTVAGPIPMDLFLWPVSCSSATIPMDVLFLCHYSYGPVAYSYAILVAGAYSYGPIPMDLMAYSYGPFPLWHIPMRCWLPGPIPMALFLWTLWPIPIVVAPATGHGFHCNMPSLQYAITACLAL